MDSFVPARKIAVYCCEDAKDITHLEHNLITLLHGHTIPACTLKYLFSIIRYTY